LTPIEALSGRRAAPLPEGQSTRGESIESDPIDFFDFIDFPLIFSLIYFALIIAPLIIDLPLICLDLPLIC